MSDTSETFLSNYPKLTGTKGTKPTKPTLSSTSSILKEFNLNNNEYLLNLKKFFKNKYVRAVLYIILILYASIIAPKLPNWIMPYLEYPIVKILIVFSIGMLATQDPIAAIIATIGVTITYLFISENIFFNNINNIIDTEEENDLNLLFEQSKKETMNMEHFNSTNENTIQNVEEHFDVLDENNSYINHVEEHFDVANINNNNNNVEEHFDVLNYDNNNQNVQYDYNNEENLDYNNYIE